jgi:hypothetical protein
LVEGGDGDIDLLVEGGDGDLDLLVEDRRFRVIFLGKTLDDDDGGGDLVKVFEVRFIFFEEVFGDGDLDLLAEDFGVRRFSVIFLGKTLDCDDDVVCSGPNSLSSLLFSLPLPFSLLFSLPFSLR